MTSHQDQQHAVLTRLAQGHGSGQEDVGHELDEQQAAYRDRLRKLDDAGLLTASQRIELGYLDAAHDQQQQTEGTDR